MIALPSSSVVTLTRLTSQTIALCDNLYRVTLNFASDKAQVSFGIGHMVYYCRWKSDWDALICHSCKFSFSSFAIDSSAVDFSAIVLLMIIFLSWINSG